jgi:hypothetical protein
MTIPRDYFEAVAKLFDSTPLSMRSPEAPDDLQQASVNWLTRSVTPA